MVKLPVATLGGCSESATATVKYELPTAVGVPEIMPVRARVRPGGGFPDETFQAKGGTPPLALRVALYGELAIPCGSVVVVTTRGGS